MIAAQEIERKKEERITVRDKEETEMDDIITHKESVDEVDCTLQSFQVIVLLPDRSQSIPHHNRRSLFPIFLQ